MTQPGRKSEICSAEAAPRGSPPGRKAKPCSAKVVCFASNPPLIPGVRLQDLVIMTKLTERDWNADLAKGDIISTRTGEPLRFSTDEHGYQTTSVRFRGRRVNVLRHRAVYIAGACRTFKDLPADFDLQVDHINNDLTDCRFENLRLITAQENNHPLSGRKKRIFTDDQVGEIRRRYEKGEGPKSLAAEFGVNRVTIHRIVSRQTYAEVGL